MRLRALALAVVVCGLGALAATAQDQPVQPKRPVEAFREIRDLINDGRFDLAAESIKDFLALRPTEQDYLDIETRYGAAAFLRLRNIPRWYDDAKKDADFKKGPLQQLIDAAQAANTKLLRDPARVQRFVFNLGATREEYLFAVQELRRSGDFVVPIMVSTLRTDPTPELRQGILSAVRALGPETVPGFIAATEGLVDELKIGILEALAARPDVLGLSSKADTDFVPALWYLASAPTGQPTLVRNATDLLRQLTGGAADTRQAAPELVAAATPLYLRRGQFLLFDSVTNRVRLWVWDPAAQTVRLLDLTKSQAEERLGLKYLRWAVDRRPGYEPAEEMFISLATERAVERANFGDLAKGDPAVYRVLAAAPSGTLITVLDTALAENRTALALGIIQVLGDRAEKAAATPEVRTTPGGVSKTRPAPLVRALTYPDPRVQFAAAVAILRTPAGPTGANGRIVEILMRALSGDAATGAQARGRALIADPRTARSDQLAGLLRGLGFATEQFGTGHELLRRVRRSSDFDIVLLDRHVPDPELRDVLTQLTADANFGRRPVLVVASADNPKPVGLEPLLLRLALLVAATETEDIPIPGIPAIDRRKSAEDVADERRRNAEERDRAYANLFRARLARLTRVVEASGVVNTLQLQQRLDLRLPQLTYAGLIAEFAPPRATAPALYRQFEQISTLLRAQPALDRAVENVATEPLVNLIVQLESALTPPLRDRFEFLRTRVDPEALGIRVESGRDLTAEAAVARVVRTVPGTVVIPEPYSRFAIETDVRAAVADPAQLPRDPGEKKAAAREAVEWLRRLATGAVPGYDVRPAGPALRQALNSDDLAGPAVEALARIPTTDAQQDLLKLAHAKQRPVPLRVQAAEATTRHIQAYGKLTSGELIAQLPHWIAEEPNQQVKAHLEAIRTLLAGTPTDLSVRIREFQFPLPPTAAPKPATTAPPPEPKDAPPPAEPK